MSIEGNYTVPDSGMEKLENVFTNSNNSLLATSFLKRWSYCINRKKYNEVSLRSFGLQPQAQFVITDDEAKTINSFSLDLENGNSVSITFSNSDKGHQVTSVRDLADILNSGITPGGTSFSFDSYGLVASGANETTIASNDQDFTSANISTRSSGTLNAILSNPTASQKKPLI